MGLLLATGAMAQMGPGNPRVSQDSIRFWTGQGSNRAVIAITWSDETAGNIGVAWGVQWNGGNIQLKSLMDTIAAYDSRFTFNATSSGTFINNFFFSDAELGLNLEGEDGWWRYNWYGTGDDIQSSGGITCDMIGNGHFVDWLQMGAADVMFYATDPNASSSSNYPFAESNVKFWAGSGSNKAVVNIDFNGTGLVYGVRWNGNLQVDNIMDSINVHDSRLTVNGIDNCYIDEMVYSDPATGVSYEDQGLGWMYKRNNAFGSSICTQDIASGDYLHFSDNFSFSTENYIFVENTEPVITCLPIVLDGTNSFTENFDTLSNTGSGILPECWSTAHVAGSRTDLWTSFSGQSAHSGRIMMKLPDMQSGNITLLTTPAFVISEANRYQVSLWVKRTNSYSNKVNEGVKVWANSTPDTVNATLLFHARRSMTQEPAVSEEGWYEYTGAIPLEDTVYIILEGISEYGQETFIDDFSLQRVPQCDLPTNLAFNADNMSLSWTAGNATQWQVRDGETLTVVNTPSYSNPDWQYATDYTVSVRSICSDGDTNDWFDNISFTTPRMPCPDIMPVPYTTTFSGFDYELSPFYANAPLPDCWDVYSNGTNRPNPDQSDYSIYYSGIGVSSSMNNYGCVTVNNPYFCFIAYAPYDGTVETYQTNMGQYGTRKFAVLPTFDMPLNRLALSFDYSMSARDGAELHIGYIVNDTADFTSLYVLPTSYRQLSHLNELDFLALADNIPANARLAMLWKTTDTVHTNTAPANYFCGIDNLTVTEAPACKYPRDFVADSIGHHGFSLTWREVSITPATQWQVAYGPQGFNLDSEGTVVNTNQNRVVVTSVATDSYYDAYVRAKCSDNTFTEWVGPITLRTKCPDGGNVILGTQELTDYTISFANWGNTVCQSLFTASELATAGLRAGDTVKNLVYNWQRGTVTSTRYTKAFSIYMTHTSTEAFPATPQATDWLPVSADNLVMADSVTLTASGLTRYDLSTPFVWNGTDGIAITTFVNQPEGFAQSSTGVYAVSSETEGRRTLFARVDRKAYNPDSLSTIAPTVSNFRANIVIERPCIDTTSGDLSPVTDAAIAASDILYWVGEGQNRVVMAINWADTALAWGYRFSSDSVVVGDIIAAIANADPRFSFEGSTSYITDFLYADENITDTLRLSPHAVGDYSVYFNMSVNHMASMLGAGAHKVVNGDFVKFADTYVAVKTDSTWIADFGGYWDYTYAWPMTIRPATVPATPEPPIADASIAASDILYWVGEGQNRVVMAINWADTALAWGYRFSSDSVVVGDMIAAIANADPRFSFEGSTSYITDFLYADENITDTLRLSPHAEGDYSVYFNMSVNHMASMLGAGAHKVVNGDFVKFADTYVAVKTDSTWIADFGGYWDYTYAWPMTIRPATVPAGVAPSEATIAASEIRYWVGEGSNKVIMVINWADTALAWGYRFSSDSVATSTMMADIAAADPRFSYSGAIADINYIDTAAGMTDTLRVTPNNWWSSLLNGTMDAGFSQQLHNGDLKKWADPAAGVVVDSIYWEAFSYMEYVYVYPMTIHPVTVPDTTGSHGPVDPEHGPFCGAVGTEGCTAVAADSSIIVAWATGVTLERGPQNISVANSDPASFGTADNAIGMATLSNTMEAVSLGDGGSALVTFAHPIRNGEGFDFAVFENSFSDVNLELAFVEVSSDGQRFVRFPATCLTPSETQLANAGATDPTNLNNLAGKYRIGHGTPFDLEELRDSTGINIDSIVYVRVVDVVGSINPAYGTYDAFGHIINDPWPTPFNTAGFDLTGVAVMHQRDQEGIDEGQMLVSNVYPNPVVNTVNVIVSRDTKAVLYDQTGRQVGEFSLRQGQNTIDMSRHTTGVYILRTEGSVCKIVKN